MFNDEFSLGPERDLSPGFRIVYFSGGRQDRHDTPMLLRARGRGYENGDVVIGIERHAILRYTPCGAWVDTWAGDRFVNLRSNKQWASTTEAEAIDQLYHRKQSEVRILHARLDSAMRVKEQMEKHLGKTPRAPRQYFPDYDY